jgi:hypothetical protein
VNRIKQLWFPIAILAIIVLTVGWILAMVVYPSNLRGSDQGLVIQDTSNPAASPSNTPSPTATSTKNAVIAILLDTPTPTHSVIPTETVPTFTAEPTYTLNCTYTIYYWRVYTDAWQLESIDLDDRSYSKDQAIAILNIDDPNLATTRLLQQYILALLNTLKGADPSGIERTLERVNEWLILHPPEIRLTQAESLEGDTFADELQDFNDGLTGPGLCIDEPLTPTPGATPTPLNYTPTPGATSTPLNDTPTPGATPTPLNYTPPATATNTPRPIGTVFFPTATPTKKPSGGKPKPTSQPTQPPPPPPTNTSPPPPSNTPKPTQVVPPTPAPTQPPPTP